MLQQVQTQLEQAQIAAVWAMDDCHPFLFLGNDTQIDDPNVSQAGGNEQARHTFRLRDMTFVQMKTPAFLVRKEGSDAEPLGIPVTDFFRQTILETR